MRVILGQIGWIGALVSLLVASDLAEGVVQIAALTSVKDWLALKELLTPLKFVLSLSGLVLSSAAWLLFALGRIPG